MIDNMINSLVDLINSNKKQNTKKLKRLINLSRQKLNLPKLI